MIESKRASSTAFNVCFPVVFTMGTGAFLPTTLLADDSLAPMACLGCGL